MRRIRFRWPSPALGVAVLALLAAVGGSAYAAGLNASKAITACVHHHGGGLYISRRCARGDRKLSWNVQGPSGATGVMGATGAAGNVGAPGKDGANGATNVVVRTQHACPTLPSGIHCAINLQCQSGERATGGGAGFADFSGTETLLVSEPVKSDGSLAGTGDVPTGWAAGIKFTGSGTRDAIGYVVCASP